jgi:hypothetical protein
MPIIFEDLETILMNWKNQLKMKKPTERTGRFVYRKMKEKINTTNIRKINSLFKTITVDDIEVKETINCDNTYGKLKKENNVYITKKKSSL